MAAVDSLNNAINHLQDAHDSLHEYAAENSAQYTPEMNMLITANLSDMLTRIGNLDAVAIAANAAVTLQQCQDLDARTQKFADAAAALEKTEQDIAKSMSFVNVGLQTVMYLAKANVYSAAKLIYNTLNPSDKGGEN